MVRLLQDMDQEKDPAAGGDTNVEIGKFSSNEVSFSVSLCKTTVFLTFKITSVVSAILFDLPGDNLEVTTSPIQRLIADILLSFW